MQTQQAAVAQSQLLQQINAMTPTWMVDSFEYDFCYSGPGSVSASFSLVM
jgi:hypothetical protein